MSDQNNQKQQSEEKIENNKDGALKKDLFEIQAAKNILEEKLKEMENSKTLFMKLLEDQKKIFELEDISNNEMQKIFKSNDYIAIDDVKGVEMLKNTKNSELIKEIKKFSKQFLLENSPSNCFLSIIEQPKKDFLEENLDNYRNSNKNNNIRILKFDKQNNFYYFGETTKGSNDIPDIMQGFGFISNEKESEYYLGFFENDNFKRGVWIKNKNDYFLGEFSYENIQEKQKKSKFSGLILSIDLKKDENDKKSYGVNVLNGTFEFNSSKFEGISIKLDESKDISFVNGTLIDGKRDSDGFLTIRIFAEEQNIDEDKPTYKIIKSDYLKDVIKKHYYVLDEFSLLKFDQYQNPKTCLSVLSYDKNIIYQGFLKSPDEEVDPILEGKGILIDCESGLKYEGEFKDGKKHGEGTLKVLSKDEKGNINQKNFHGIFFDDSFVNGDVIEDEKIVIKGGEFDENFVLKRGEILFDNNETYKGEFKENNRNGFGIYRYDSKCEYHGSWKNGLRDGEGTLIMADRKKKISGIWVENNLKEIIKTENIDDLPKKSEKENNNQNPDAISENKNGKETLLDKGNQDKDKSLDNKSIIENQSNLVSNIEQNHHLEEISDKKTSVKTESEGNNIINDKKQDIIVNNLPKKDEIPSIKQEGKKLDNNQKENDIINIDKSIDENKIEPKDNDSNNNKAEDNQNLNVVNNSNSLKENKNDNAVKEDPHLRNYQENVNTNPVQKEAEKLKDSEQKHKIEEEEKKKENEGLPDENNKIESVNAVYDVKKGEEDKDSVVPEELQINTQEKNNNLETDSKENNHEIQIDSQKMNQNFKKDQKLKDDENEKNHDDMPEIKNDSKENNQKLQQALDDKNGQGNDESENKSDRDNNQKDQKNKDNNNNNNSNKELDENKRKYSEINKNSQQN